MQGYKSMKDKTGGTMFTDVKARFSEEQMNIEQNDTNRTKFGIK